MTFAVLARDGAARRGRLETPPGVVDTPAGGPGPGPTPPAPAPPRGARRSLARHRAGAGPGQACFGIVQGGVHADLRREAAEATVGLGFDGHALGGFAVGEPRGLMLELVALTAAALPADRPRYLMGVGRPPDLVEAVAVGVDLFDCVL